MKIDLKPHIMGMARFNYFRDSALWYRTDATGLLFPVPLDDIGTTTFDAQYPAIKLMRWIRKYVEQHTDQLVLEQSPTP